MPVRAGVDHSPDLEYVHPHPLANQRHFVGKSDVHVAIGVFHHFGHLGRPHSGRRDLAAHDVAVKRHGATVDSTITSVPACMLRPTWALTSRRES